MCGWGSRGQKLHKGTTSAKGACGSEKTVQSSRTVNTTNSEALCMYGCGPPRSYRLQLAEGIAE
jgi:hypothetical protein